MYCEFDKIFYSIFNNKRLMKFAKGFDIEQNNDGFIIYDGKRKIGEMIFNIDKNNKIIEVPIVLIDHKYENTSAALSLFKKFHTMYKNSYDGYKIKAEFANYKLAEFFNRLIEKGFFPKDCNITEKHPDFENPDKYNKWKDKENKYFDKQRDIDYNNLPEPFFKINQNRDNFFGYDVIYKNLTDSELTAIVNGANIVGTQAAGFAVANSDVYYTFGVGTFKNLNTNFDLLYYPLSQTIITKNLNLISQYKSQIEKFTGYSVLPAKIVITNELDSASINYYSDYPAYFANSVEELQQELNPQKKRKFAKRLIKR